MKSFGSFIGHFWFIELAEQAYRSLGNTCFLGSCECPYIYAARSAGQKSLIVHIHINSWINYLP